MELDCYVQEQTSRITANFGNALSEPIYDKALTKASYSESRQFIGTELKITFGYKNLVIYQTDLLNDESPL